MRDVNVKDDCFSYLFNLSNGYMASRIFLTALELGVFDQLGTRQLTFSQLANQIKTDERATEILLNALTGMKLLEKRGNLFNNVKEFAGFLISSNTCYKGGLFNHNANLWDAWSNLTDIVKSGRPYNGEWTDDKKHDLASAMKQYSKGKAGMIANLFNGSDVNRVLDLGGGPGSYAIAFAKSNANLNSVVFDRDDQAYKIAKDDIEREGLQERIELRRGDFLVDDIGSGYDLVILSSIVCLFGDDTNSLLFRKIKESLNDGGRIVVSDLMLDESKTKPVSAAVFAVNMLVNTQSGRSYTSIEVKELLRSLGFKDIHRLPVEHSQVIIGRK